ncbi:alpha/beta hydrolase [Actinoplanes ianthinogenes]|uniref:Alpha/beta hydrolase n=1 Tax=Actinoplanes ianthinogenes TaxID=122358 RepID=A0ABM7M818_9ACTN|nr:alpha/beta hydrolase [Actinoplanes ianthinogenes]BCJ47757.1 alpha/beta hydrolase [Actinoplanes ianthinogenes]GGR03972.1 alpha/beta hydrolase [Actinoplanes ianthinogenes]
MDIAFTEYDRGRTFLLLHGGAGPASMTGFAGLLAERTRSRVLVPTHPGFAGTVRPGTLASTRDLAAAYVEWLDRLDLSRVTVVGNSFGGWLAAEIALLAGPRVTGAVIVNGVGIEVDGHPIARVAGLAPAELRKLSFHDVTKAPAGPGPGPDVEALIAYAGPAMADPTLLDRLGALDLPVHVIWGESDGIVDVGYGKAYAAAIPGSTFTVLPESGHLPQVETPADLLEVIAGPGRA